MPELTRRIVTSTYRYKRPPPKKLKAVALGMPAVATIASKRVAKAPEVVAQKAPAPPAKERKSAIITARKPGAKSSVSVPDLTEEEINRRADAAEALFGKIARGQPSRAGGDTASAIGAATPTRRCPQASKLWTSLSAPFRRGSCGSPATAAVRTG